MKVFISQPMSGLPREQVLAEREEVVNLLESQGYEVVDSMFGFEGQDLKNEGLHYIGHSILDMAEADAVVFVNGWRSSQRCRVEYDLAKRHKLFIKEL